MAIKINKQLVWSTYTITLTMTLALLFACPLSAHVISFSVPYNCFVDSKTHHDPWWTWVQYEKQAYCKHTFIIANASNVRLFYSFINESSNNQSDQALHYEIIAPHSFAEYAWQQDSERISSNFSEWDPVFNLNNATPPSDPTSPSIGNKYLIISRTQASLKNALEAGIKTKNWDANFPDTAVIKFVANQSAKNSDNARSAITITNDTLIIDSIVFASGTQTLKMIQENQLSKIAPQPYLLK